MNPPDKSQPKKHKSGARLGRPKLGEENGRELLLTEAIRSFAREGFDGVNIRTLTKEAGVNIALANYHFGSKAALWEAALTRLCEDAGQWISQLRTIAASDLDWAVKLRDFYLTFIELNAEIPDLGFFIMQEVVRTGVRVQSIREKLVAPLHELGVRVLEEAIAKGGLPQQNPSLLFFMTGIAISNVFAEQGLLTSFIVQDWSPAQQKNDVLRAVLTMIAGQLRPDLESVLISTENYLEAIG